MALPRSKYVIEGAIAVYHCTTRCVRRAFLCGRDRESGRNFSHRKKWIEERLCFLSSIFAVEVVDYSVMSNHYHVILRTRPDIVDTWTDYEVARRWLTLCPSSIRSKKTTIEEQIHNLSLCTDRIAQLRKRLSNLSWFMKQLNEFIARAANKEDDVKGRFWESRFKCQVLLDDGAIASCMVYVDLNPIRAGLAETPEVSDFTSIQRRIRDWQNSSNKTVPVVERWLCPIERKAGQYGILPMSEAEYFELVDASGRLIRSDKRGSIDSKLEPILQRLKSREEAWVHTVTDFSRMFGLVVGTPSRMADFADQIGKKWFVGSTAAQQAFN
ncbi:MAG: transposase [Acidobacteriota bacterium]